VLFPNCFSEITGRLANLSLNPGHFPNKFKFAVVKPVDYVRNLRTYLCSWLSPFHKETTFLFSSPPKVSAKNYFFSDELAAIILILHSPFFTYNSNQI